MKQLKLVVILLLVYNANGWKIFHHGRQKQGFVGLPKTNINPEPPSPDLWFTQKLDHFDPTNTDTWQQRYMVNDTFYKEGGPVFLMIGGEGKANAIWMVEGAWIEYAKLFNALCFQLEHRYYGKSHPTNDLSVKNLVYLSSEQALADLSYFVEKMNEKYKLTDDNKWISFGGSYPGSLAAWTRVKYPHLIHASISASGPLLAVADFKEYMGVVRDSLATHSEDCVNNVAKATKQLELLLQHRLGQLHIDEIFRTCDTVVNANKLDISNLFENLAGNFAGVVQYNKDNREFEGAKDVNFTIDAVCDIMNDNSLGTEVSRYATVNSRLLDISEQKCLDYKYNKMITDYQNTTWNASTAAGGRQWLYQTCTEFGFYQTSTLKDQPFGTRFPLDFFIKQCSDIFGPRYDKTLLIDGIERTNIMYGALHPQLSRVVFIHGSIDPWHALGITKSNDPSTPAIYIKGTAHCANMYPESVNDPPQLTAARQSVIGFLSQWLQPNDAGIRVY